jgi:hypothetical protein
MSHEIRGNWDTLMRQASSTAVLWFDDCLTTIMEAADPDRDQPRRRPAKPAEIAAAVELSKVSATDFLCTSIGIAAQSLSQSIAALSLKLGGDNDQDEG